MEARSGEANERVMEAMKRYLEQMPCATNRDYILCIFLEVRSLLVLFLLVYR